MDAGVNRIHFQALAATGRGLFEGTCLEILHLAGLLEIKHTSAEFEFAQVR